MSQSTINNFVERTNVIDTLQKRVNSLTNEINVLEKRAEKITTSMNILSMDLNEFLEKHNYCT